MESVLQQKIKNFLDTTGESVAALERKAGLKTNVARNILRGQSKRPTAETLQAIATVMGCTVSDLLGVQQNIPQQKNDNSPVVDHPEMLQQALESIIEISKAKHRILTLDQVLLMLDETYNYSLQKQLPQVDSDFIAWLMEKTVR